MRLRMLTADEIRSLSKHGSVVLPESGRRLTWPLDDTDVLGYRIAALAANPESAPYLLHVALDAHEAFLARIGCHAAPDSDGSVEIGYYVAATHRGRGQAGELLDWFIGWLEQQGVSEIVATVRPDNVVSLHLLRARDFEEAGKQWDEQDGLELVMKRPATCELRRGSPGGSH